jgi:ribosomal protein S3
VSGKLRGQRAKSMKFVDGLMIHSGDPCNDYVDTACRHVLLRQGVLGIKVCRLIFSVADPDPHFFVTLGSFYHHAKIL